MSKKKTVKKDTTSVPYDTGTAVRLNEGDAGEELGHDMLGKRVCVLEPDARAGRTGVIIGWDPSPRWAAIESLGYAVLRLDGVLGDDFPVAVPLRLVRETTDTVPDAHVVTGASVPAKRADALVEIRLEAAEDSSLSVVVTLPVPLPEVVVSEQRAFVLVDGHYKQATAWLQPPLRRKPDGERRTE